MNLGFIGTGKIASSIIYGIFKSKLKINKIYISSRNINIAKKLSKKFKKVIIFKNNQELINKSSVIILSITPAVGKRILGELKFSKNKTIISLISTIKLNELKKLTGTKKICKAIPLPFIENKIGPIVVSPKNKTAKRIFSKLGNVIEVNNEKISYNFWSTSSIMAAYYEILNISTNWLVKKGVNRKMATKYIAELFLSLSKDADIKQKIGFKKLVADSQTPKGLNMLVLKELKKSKFYDIFIKSLNSVYTKIRV
ncbi:MAG: pyrroline-5-carboxylate reductase [Candidatus Pelagibacter sp.]|nr:pyrroline-5-carboxylate reductase [Candidatus Pelagibacter sp.]|tara:strand:+ start:1625 stop:2389 length:765 start_codon:yes stop_codon:yes gene_type:complete